LAAVWVVWPSLYLRGSESEMENRTSAVIVAEESSSMKVVELTPDGRSSVMFFVLLLGPGLLATHSWWTRRRE
jgi:hypothetical protein